MEGLDGIDGEVVPGLHLGVGRAQVGVRVRDSGVGHGQLIVLGRQGCVGLRRLDQPPGRPGDAGKQCKQHETRRDHLALVPADELAQPVASAGRTGFNDLVGQVTLNVAGQAVGRLVAPGRGPSPAPSSRSSPARRAPASSAAPAPSAGRRPATAACRLELSRVLGRGGSSSRMIRRISSQAASLNRCFSSGVVPVSSS